MIYFLGLITGILLDLSVLIILLYLKNPIEREIHQLESRLKEKGEVFMQDDNQDDLETFINKLPTE